MSKIKNGGLDQYGAEPFERQKFGTAGVEGVHVLYSCWAKDRNYIVQVFPSLNEAMKPNTWLLTIII